MFFQAYIIYHFDAKKLKNQHLFYFLIFYKYLQTMSNKVNSRGCILQIPLTSINPF